MMERTQIYILKPDVRGLGLYAHRTPPLRWHRYQKCGNCKGTGDLNRRLSSFAEGAWTHKRGARGRTCLNCRGEGYHWTGYADDN